MQTQTIDPPTVETVQEKPKLTRPQLADAFWCLNWAILNTIFRSSREERKFKQALANAKKRLDIE